MVGAVASMITKITDLAQLLEYLREYGYDLAEYLTEEQVATIVWSGRGAELVGLVGEADEDDARRILQGVDPEDLESERLVVRTPPPESKRRRVMGFELSFAPPKSVAALWAIGSDEVRAHVDAAHKEALGAALGVLEERVAVARVRRGKEDVDWVRGAGLLTMHVRHESSRAGDPQPHDHVLVPNMVWAAGKWRALDTRFLYGARPLAASAYGRTLQRALITRLGVEWTQPAGRNSVREIAGLGGLAELWSKRRREIEDAVAEAVERRRREVAAEVQQLRAVGAGDEEIARVRARLIDGEGAARRVAASVTRDVKDLRETRAEKRQRWRFEAIAIVAAAGRDAGGGERGVVWGVSQALWAETAGDVRLYGQALRIVVAMKEIPEIDDEVVAVLWTQALAVGAPERLIGEVVTLADIERQVLGRGEVATGWDRERATRAATRSLTERLTTWDHDELVTTLLEVEPDASFDELETLAVDIERGAWNLVEGIAVVVQGGDGSRRGARPGWQRWATRATLDAERAVLDWWENATVEEMPAVAVEVVAERCEAVRLAGGEALDDAQVLAVDGLLLARGGVLAARGGAGKTAAMAGVRAVLEPEGVRVVGLAVGEAATRQLGEDAGMVATNTAKALELVRHLHEAEHRAGGFIPDEAAEREADRLRRRVETVLPTGGCWIVDEATMVDTQTWRRLIRLADQRGARMIAIGDPAQLDAVAPGGIFAAVVARCRHEVLLKGRRFRERWYDEAVAALRDGDKGALGRLADRGRLVGAGEDPIGEIVDMWAAATAEEMPDVGDDPHSGVARIASLRATKRDHERRRLAEEWGVEEDHISNDDLLGADVLSDVLVVAATRGEVDALNAAIRDVANPPAHGAEEAAVRWVDVDGEEHTWTFRVGDVVRTAAGEQTIRTTSRATVANGRRWQIVSISGDYLKVESLDGEGLVEFPPSYWQAGDPETSRPLLHLGYAGTVHRAQGLTSDVALALGGHGHNAASLYVAMSRGRWGTYLVGHGDTLDVLLDAREAAARPGHTTAAAEAHRLGLEAGGMTPDPEPGEGRDTPDEDAPPPVRRTGPRLGF